jgi:hypothetical protein
MSKKGIVLFTFMAIVLVLIFVFAKLGRDVVGINVEGLYKIGECYGNDEFGVTYKVTNTSKGLSFATVVASDKYPSQEDYKMGAETRWSSVEPFGKLQPATCP